LCYAEVIGKKLALTNADGSVAAKARDSMHRDATIGSTNPAVRVWLWDQVRDGYRADGFDYFWMDETEPAEPILVKYLKLRYRLLPYIYAQAHKAEEDGRALDAGTVHGFPVGPQGHRSE
jgi:alpha-glucosidase (family GH31 glycosyl hydrolase)